MKINGKEVIEIRPMTRWEYAEKYCKGFSKNCNYCRGKIESKYCYYFVNGKFKMIVRVKKMTNFEKIKAMSVEDMAEWIDLAVSNGCTVFCFEDMHDCDLDCGNNICRWLESEVEK